MNVKLAEEIRDKILDYPDNVDMDMWISENPYDGECGLLEENVEKLRQGCECGVVACIAGWAIVLGKRGEEYVEIDPYVSVHEAALRLLELSLQEADQLFYPRYWLIPDAEETLRKLRGAEYAGFVADYIDYFIKEVSRHDGN